MQQVCQIQFVSVRTFNGWARAWKARTCFPTVVPYSWTDLMKRSWPFPMVWRVDTTICRDLHSMYRTNGHYSSYATTLAVGTLCWQVQKALMRTRSGEDMKRRGKCDCGGVQRTFALVWVALHRSPLTLWLCFALLPSILARSSEQERMDCFTIAHVPWTRCAHNPTPRFTKRKILFFKVLCGAPQFNTWLLCKMQLSRA